MNPIKEAKQPSDQPWENPESRIDTETYAVFKGQAPFVIKNILFKYFHGLLPLNAVQFQAAVLVYLHQIDKLNFLAGFSFLASLLFLKEKQDPNTMYKTF